MNAYSIVFPAIALLLSASAQATDINRYDKAMAELNAAKTEANRFYALNDAAKESLNAGKFEDARRYAEELQKLLPKYAGNWNYGNAVQDVNIVLGRLALREGKIDEAKNHLLKAGRSPGSPQMDSFGPNMSLAKELLEKGEKETVLQYLDLCAKFWEMDDGQLAAWKAQVKKGEIPDFGPNLIY